MNRCSLGGLVVAALTLAATCNGRPCPAVLFSDHAVLQRDVRVPVWGVASPGERISVEYRDVKAETVASDDGQWCVSLPPMSACHSADLIIRGEEILVARDVAVGDVWLLGGQSNMEWPLSRSDDGTATAAAADRPWMRHLKVPHRVSDAPTRDLQAAWVPGSRENALAFSAVGFFFAHHLYGDGKVPVGLLNVTYGGTVIEAWMGPKAIASAAHGSVVMSRWQEVMAAYPHLQQQYLQEISSLERARITGTAADNRIPPVQPLRPIGPGYPTQPSGLYHGMLTTVLPCAIAGVIWYQGESNVMRGGEYADLLRAMIGEWRAGFERSDLPFIIVQLPNYRERKVAGQVWTEVRAAQAQVAQRDPHSFLVVTIDLGDSKDKHPRNKYEVGRRIALVARRHVFGHQIAADAPTVQAASRDGVGIVLEFEAQHHSLTLRPAGNDLRLSFEIAGEDGVFVPADATLRGNRLFIASELVPHPAFARYLWHDDPCVRLFDKEGLPAAPFSIDLRGYQ